MFWAFDVSSSNHDLLQEGITEAWWSRVTVWADTYNEASCIAIEMVMCTGKYATGCYIRI